MDLRIDARVPFPRLRVFATYRDHIADLLPYLPNVRSVTVQSRVDEGPVTKLVNVWSGGGDVPAAIRAVLGDSLSWTDYATWDEGALRCDWRNETAAFGEAMKCVGTNAYLEDGPDKTLIEIRGSLVVDGTRLRGVPRLFAGKVGRAIEEFLGSKIGANLVETAKGVTQYLAQAKV
jgi:hypothetical protein